MPVPNLDLQEEKSVDDDLGNTLDDLLDAQNLDTGQVVVLSTNPKNRRQLISALSAGNYHEKPVDDDGSISIEMTKLKTPSGKTVELLGFYTDGRFLKLMEQMNRTLLGYVVLSNGNNPSGLGYLGYLINHLKNIFTCPHLVAVSYKKGEKPIPLDYIRYSLRMGDEDQIIDLDTADRDSVIHLLQQLKQPEYLSDANPGTGEMTN
jgi:hypothetical protein